MDKTDAFAALTANGLVKMEGVRGDTYVYPSVGGNLTYFTLRDGKFYAEGDISVLPKMMGYSEDEIRRAVYEATDDNMTTVVVMDVLKNNREESVE
jgi:hypothetical protein